jgi:hypothetical protein
MIPLHRRNIGGFIDSFQSPGRIDGCAQHGVSCAKPECAPHSVPWMCKYAPCDGEASCGVSWQPSRLSYSRNVYPPPRSKLIRRYAFKEPILALGRPLHDCCSKFQHLVSRRVGCIRATAPLSGSFSPHVWPHTSQKRPEEHPQARLRASHPARDQGRCL